MYVDFGVTIVDIQETTTIVHGEVDTSKAGVYILTYTVTDLSGNETVVVRYVTVTQQERVEFVLGKAKTSLKVGEIYTDGSCHVLIGEYSYECTINSHVNVSNPGIYTIIYSYVHNDLEYTYKRYVFVYDDALSITLYFRKEEEVIVI